MEIVNGVQRSIVLENQHTGSKRYKTQEKKPWIFAYYALMAGTQRRQQRLEFEKKKAAAMKIIEQQEKDRADQADKAAS